MSETPDFKQRLAQITVRNSKRKHLPGQHWPIAKKIEVVTQYLVLGNMKLVSAVTGVSWEVIRAWRGQPWWKELESEIRATENIEMDTKLSKIVDKSLDATLDRVENGDFIYDQKSGEIRRKPVALRDVHRVAVDILAKRELLRGNATERKENTQISVKEQLTMLAQEFAKWVDKDKHPIIELEEVEDAVYEEREEGLQDGSGEVHLEAGSEEEEGGAERSPSGNDESWEGPQG